MLGMAKCANSRNAKHAHGKVVKCANCWNVKCANCSKWRNACLIHWELRMDCATINSFPFCWKLNLVVKRRRTKSQIREWNVYQNIIFIAFLTPFKFIHERPTPYWLVGANCLSTIMSHDRETICFNVSGQTQSPQVWHTVENLSVSYTIFKVATGCWKGVKNLSLAQWKSAILLCNPGTSQKNPCSQTQKPDGWVWHIFTMVK